MKYFWVLVLMLPLPEQAFSANFDPAQQDFSRLLLAEAKRLSLDEAVAVVKKQIDGRIMAAAGARMDGRDGYRIKVLTSRGEVRIFFVDALSGEIK